MPNVTGTVVEISLNKTVLKADKSGTYPGWQLIYQTADGKINEVSKHVNGLKFNPALKEGLSSLAVGDTFTAVVEKEGKFNEWKSIVKGGDLAVNASQPLAEAPKSGKVTGSNYETAEERAKRQVIIVRQSSLSNALEYFNIQKQDASDPSPEEVMDLAEKFANFVFNQPQEEEPN